MEGVVTDAVIYPKALSREAFERLPVFCHYKSTAEADDWSNPSGEPRDASKYKAKQDKMKANRIQRLRRSPTLGIGGRKGTWHP